MAGSVFMPFSFLVGECCGKRPWFAWKNSSNSTSQGKTRPLKIVQPAWQAWALTFQFASACSFSSASKVPVDFRTAAKELSCPCTRKDGGWQFHDFLTQIGIVPK